MASPPRGDGGLSIDSIALNNNIPPPALSPMSIAGSDWTVSKYNSGGPDSLYGGTINSMPPRSSIPASERGSPESRRVSPPASIARTSDGMSMYADSGTQGPLKKIVQEEEVAAHHNALRRFLQQYLSQPGNVRPNKARDKLLRLSAIQFQELSTDVYDELQRRDNIADRPGPHNPPHLLPKEDFHPKRNQARQKLSTLPMTRFRDLATDVFYELERRFPKFNSGLLNSPTNSLDGRGMPPPNVGPGMGPGMGPPPRMGSPGPGRRMSPGPGMMRGPPPNGYSPRGPPGPGGPGGPNNFGRPLPKNFQQNTIVPNKSTMVEDDDDAEGDEGDAFGLDTPGMRNGRRNTASTRRESTRSMQSHTSNEADKKLIEEYRGKVELLQEKVAGLETSMEEKDRELENLRQGQQSNANEENDRKGEWEDLRLQLEGKLADAERLNDDLQNELAKVKADRAAGEKTIQTQMRDMEVQMRELEHDLADREHDLAKKDQEIVAIANVAPSRGGDGTADEGELDDLRRQNESLRQELREQEEVTEEVRNEAVGFLTQMRTISARADATDEREEKLNGEIQKLEAECKEWKSRYAKAKATVRSLRTSSIGLPMGSTKDLLSSQAALVGADGMIKAVHLTKFQISIDELLRLARSINYMQSLDQVKYVVNSVREITSDVTEGGRNADEKMKLKSRVSATANNLTTAAKNHATGHGLSPVSLLDAAASHLTASVVELIKLVKLRPSTAEDEEEAQEFLGVTDGDDDLIISPDDPENRYLPVGVGTNGYGHPTPALTADDDNDNNESLYSDNSSPRDSGILSRERSRNGSAMLGDHIGAQSKNWGAEVENAGGLQFGIRTSGGSEVEELRTFLETETEYIVESIQLLLSSLRSDSPLPTLHSHMSTISNVVTRVLTHTSASTSHTLQERASRIVEHLNVCRDKMESMLAEDEGVVGEDGVARAEKGFKTRLAGVAFDMARETKELVRTVEEIDNEARGMVDLS